MGLKKFLWSQVAEQRHQIIKIILKYEQLAEDVDLVKVKF